MSFRENLKLIVKQKANFTCCWCRDHAKKVDVHHIIRESEGGPDTAENAAPLCGSCHDLYGNNPDLKKEIRLRRDRLYELCTAGAPYFMTAPSLPPLSQSEQILDRVATLAGKLTEGLWAGRLRFSDTEARQMLSELFESRGHLREDAGLLQALRDLENSGGWILSRKDLFESAAERNETLRELEHRYQAVIAEVRRLRSVLE